MSPSAASPIPMLLRQAVHGDNQAICQLLQHLDPAANAQPQPVASSQRQQRQQRQQRHSQSQQRQEAVLQLEAAQAIETLVLQRKRHIRDALVAAGAARVLGSLLLTQHPGGQLASRCCMALWQLCCSTSSPTPARSQQDPEQERAAAALVKQGALDVAVRLMMRKTVCLDAVPGLFGQAGIVAALGCGPDGAATAQLQHATSAALLSQRDGHDMPRQGLLGEQVRLLLQTLPPGTLPQERDGLTEGVCILLVELLRPTRQEGVKREAVVSLSAVLAADAKYFGPFVVAAGAVPALVSLLQPAADHTLPATAAASLGVLATDPSHHAALAAAGAIPALLRLISNSSENSQVRRAALFTLGCLCRPGDSVRAVVAAGALPLLTRLLLPGNAVDLQQSAMLPLSRMMDSDGVAAAFAACESFITSMVAVVTVLVDTVAEGSAMAPKAGVDNEVVVRSALSLIRSSLEHQLKAGERQRQAVVGAQQQALKQGRQATGEGQKHGGGEGQQLGAEEQLQATGQGQQHARGASTTENATQPDEHDGSAALAEALISAGILPLLGTCLSGTSAASAWAADGGVQRNAAWALSRLLCAPCCIARPARAQIIAALVPLLQQSQLGGTPPLTLEGAVTALINLIVGAGADSKAGMQQAMEAGAGPALVALLGHPDPGAQLAAVRAVRCLAHTLRTQDHRDVSSFAKSAKTFGVLSSGTAAGLVTLLQHKDPEVRFMAVDAIAVLAGHTHKAGAALKAAGALPALAELQLLEGCTQEVLERAAEAERRIAAGCMVSQRPASSASAACALGMAVVRPQCEGCGAGPADGEQGGGELEAGAGVGEQQVGRSRLSSCAGCAAVRYCSRQCQVAHWPAHKARCKELAAMREACKAALAHCIINVDELHSIATGRSLGELVRFTPRQQHEARPARAPMLVLDASAGEFGPEEAAEVQNIQNRLEASCFCP